MKGSLEKKTYARFGLALVLLTAAGGVGYWYNELLAEAATWVAHTYEVRLGLNDLSAEIDQFFPDAMTQDPVREPQLRSRATVATMIQYLRKLTEDNPDQQRRLLALAENADNFAARAQEALTNRRTHGAEVTLADLRSESARAAHGRLRAEMKALDEAEAKLLEERKNSQRKLRAMLLAIGALVIVVSLGLVTWAGSAMLRDIAARRKAEAELARGHKFFSTTLTSIGDGVVSTDANGCVTFMNEIAEQMTGWKIADAAGKSLDVVFDIFDETTKKPLANPVRDVLRTGQIAKLANHTVLRARDGRETAIEDSAAPIRGDDGVLQGVVLVFHDSSERVQREKLILAAREYSENIVETVRSPLAVLDRELNVVSANRAFHRTFMTDPEMVAKRNFFGLAAGAWDEPELRAKLERVLPEDFSFQNYVLEKNIPELGWKALAVSARKIYRPGNHTGLILVVIEDETARRQAEAALREQGVLHEAILTSTSAIVVSMKLDGTVELFNQAAERMLGYPAADVVGRLNATAFFDPQELSRHAKKLSFEQGAQVNAGFDALVARVQAERSDENEWSFVRKDGSRFWGRLSIAKLLRRDGSVGGYIGVGTDLSAIKRAEEALKRSFMEADLAREQVDAIVRSVPNGLIMADLEERILIMNEAAERLLGVRSAEVIGKSLGKGGLGDTLSEKLKNALTQKDGSGAFDLQIKPPGQGMRIVHAHTSVVRDQDGQARGVVMVFEDVTLERDVARMKTEFLSTAAHELRTPLTSIRGFSEILLTRTLDERKRRHFLETINEQSVHLANLINDLLDLSRIESGRGLELRRSMTDLLPLTQELVATFAERGLPHRFSIKPESGPFLVYCDKDRIRQVIQNLLSNATKYSPSGGEVRIGFEASDTLARVAISDEGIGMTPEQVGRVFERFYRVDASNTAAVEGTGLGMPIVKAIVEQHEGSVVVESKVGLGTTVVLTLPTAPTNGHSRRPQN